MCHCSGSTYLIRSFDLRKCVQCTCCNCCLQFFILLTKDLCASRNQSITELTHFLPITFLCILSPVKNPFARRVNTMIEVHKRQARLASEDNIPLWHCAVGEVTLKSNNRVGGSSRIEKVNRIDLPQRSPGCFLDITVDLLNTGSGKIAEK